MIAESLDQRYTCWNQFAAARASGRLPKPKTCEHCGKKTKSRRLHGHHADYSKPLEVVWLCIPCHALEHRRIRALAGKAHNTTKLSVSIDKPIFKKSKKLAGGNFSAYCSRLIRRDLEAA